MQTEIQPETKTDRGVPPPCSKCRGHNDKWPQKYCRECHTTYQRNRRDKQREAREREKARRADERRSTWDNYYEARCDKALDLFERHGVDTIFLAERYGVTQSEAGHMVAKARRRRARALKSAK